MGFREIKTRVTGNVQYDGAGVKLVRVIGNRDVYDFDPFLMMDAFDSMNPKDYVEGFPWHPHRGIETITYLLKGEIVHGDSLGNEGTIVGGGCQWMTAGSGIIHQEMPQESLQMLGVQLWLNLPAQSKMEPPAYHEILPEDVPEVEIPGGLVRVIAGEYEKKRGAWEGNYVKPVILDVSLEPGGTWEYSTREEDTVFLYIFRGNGIYGDRGSTELLQKSAILLERGSYLELEAKEEGIRFLLLMGQPLKEPIAWGGPIVMNTREELNLAFQELEEGTFLKSTPDQ